MSININAEKWTAIGKLSNILKFDISRCLKKGLQGILPGLTYGAETLMLTKKTVNKIRVEQKAIERSMLCFDSFSFLVTHFLLKSIGFAITGLTQSIQITPVFNHSQLPQIAYCDTVTENNGIVHTGQHCLALLFEESLMGQPLRLRLYTFLELNIASSVRAVCLKRYQNVFVS